MRISKIVCDGCGKEIMGDPIKVFAEKVDRETGDFTTEGSAALYAPDKDFCDECFNRIKSFIETMGKEEVLVIKPTTEKEIAELREAIKNAPLTILQEEPTVEEVPKPAESEQPKKELPKVEPVKKQELPKEPKPPSVVDLVLQGMSKQEVCRMTGCKPITYDQTKYQLKKKGLLPKEEDDKEPVKCSEVHDSCVYGTVTGAHDTCDYIGITGHMRTCPAEKCTAYERKGK